MSEQKQIIGSPDGWKIEQYETLFLKIQNFFRSLSGKEKLYARRVVYELNQPFDLEPGESVEILIPFPPPRIKEDQ